jgi:hypothetical protein
MGTDRRPTAARVTSLLLACSLALSACAVRRAPKPVDWTTEDVLIYRLVTKADFHAKTSNSAWGNFAHGAEICTIILPIDDDDETWEFHAVMKPACSFWNKAVGPIGYTLRLLGLALGIPVIVSVKQPDWYILQHEQIHFAINQVAALQLTRKLAEISSSRINPSLIRSVYTITRSHTDHRHRDFDLETSGTFRPADLEK